MKDTAQKKSMHGQGEKKSTGVKYSCLWGILLFAVLIFIDQITKAAAAAYLKPSDSIPIVEGWLEIRIVYNRGISYGLGDDASPAVKIAVIAATAVMMLAITIFYFKVDKKRISRKGRKGFIWGIALVAKPRGKHLPIGETTAFKKIHKFKRAFPETSAGIIPVKGGYMHKHSACSFQASHRRFQKC